MLNAILFPVLIVAGIGLVSGIGLAVASIVMAVPKDEKAEAIGEMLPGANCGACGFSGCAGYAAALAHGNAVPGLCAPGGAAVSAQISSFLGLADSGVEKKVAMIHCLGSYDNTSDKMEYDGIMSCAAASQLAGGITSCKDGCMGLGDCFNACQYGAIEICNGLARVNPERCVGCSMCVKACPKHLIALVPAKPIAVNRCSNCDKGAQTTKVCKIGCIGCMKCVKVCEAGAVKVENFHAIVDPEKCVACGKCVEACPRHCITMANEAK